MHLLSAPRMYDPFSNSEPLDDEHVPIVWTFSTHGIATDQMSESGHTGSERNTAGGIRTSRRTNSHPCDPSSTVMEEGIGHRYVTPQSVIFYRGCLPLTDATSSSCVRAGLGPFLPAASRRSNLSSQ